MDWGREGIGHAADLVKGREIARNLRSRGKFQSNIYYCFIPCSLKFTFSGGAVERGKRSKMPWITEQERWDEGSVPKLTRVVTYFRD